ncbi:MAG: translation initiation factor IF-3 [Eubacteriales bacterium]|nr:translation initiation factor IF-3 [Eubacteriales bacterium]
MRTISKDRTLINGEIRDRELRVIASNGEQLGILSKREALEEAEKKNLDLVLISPRANPPVAKIMDYGKYRYDKQKKEKENRKKQKNMQVKEIRLSTFIEDHDIEVKAKAASKFLKNGDKVKVSLRFRGRERDYKDRGFEVMNRFADVVSDVAEVEKKPKFEGRSLTMFVAPKPDKK